MIRTNKFYYSFLLQAALSACLISSLVSCNYKKESRVEHEGAKSTELSIDKDIVEIQGKAITAEELKSIYSSLSTAKSNAEFELVLNKLETTVINQNSINNPLISKTEETKLALSYYNYALIKLSETSGDKTLLENKLAYYESLIQYGCDESLKGCQNISFFKTDQRSAQVMVIIANNMDQKLSTTCAESCFVDLIKYYNHLGISFDLGNGVRNKTLEFLYLKRAQQYGLLAKNASPDFTRRHGVIFENIVSLYPADPQNPQFSDFVKKFNPWSYSRLNSNPFSYGIQKMFSFAANHYLYSEDKKSLNPDIKKVIIDSQNDNDLANPSFVKSVKDLQNDSLSAEILKNLSFDVSMIDHDNFLNEYFFMIDRLYRGHLGFEEINSIWAGSKKDENEFLKIVNFYTKVEFLKTIIATNKYMSSIFSQKDLPNDILFKQIVQKSEPLTKEWGIMFTKLENISIFATQQLRNSKTLSSSLKDIQLMIDGVKRNAKFLSVYPNMLLLGYYMIDLNAPLTFNAWWGGTISVDPTTVMTALLDGSFSQPWFIYGGDTTSLNKTEIVYAFYYALNAGVFDTYSSIKDINGKPSVDKVSFFKKALKKTMQTNIDEMKNSLQITINNRQSSPLYSSLINVCDAENSHSKDYSIAMKLEDLQNYSLFGSGTRGILSSAYNFYSGHGSFDGLQQTRIDLETRLTQIKSMLDILKINLKSSDPSLKELESELSTIESLKKSYIKEIVSQHQKISKCTNKLMWEERQRQSDLMTKEMVHLGKVYDALATLRNLEGDAKKAKRKELSTALELSSGETLLDDSYTYNQYGLLRRLVRYSNLYKPKINFEEPDSLTKDSLEKTSITILFYNKSKNQSVSRDQFIGDGMTILNSQNSHTLLWLQETASIEYWQKKIDAMMQMYLMTFDANTIKDPESSINADEIINDNLEMMKFIDIQDSETSWLTAMNRPERIPNEKLKGILFINTENDYKGILDNLYEQIVGTKSYGNKDQSGQRSSNTIEAYLTEAGQYYTATKNIGSFLFKVDDNVTKSIDENYQGLVNRSEAILNDITAAIKKSELQFDKSKFKITYRLKTQSESALIYTTDQIDGGTSVLLDYKKQKDMNARLRDFHQNITNNHFKANK